jgi:hypothetical protein
LTFEGATVSLQGSSSSNLPYAFPSFEINLVWYSSTENVLSIAAILDIPLSAQSKAIYITMDRLTFDTLRNFDVVTE